ncbi:MAG: pantetheine-phosphate adenylyltransferase [Malacoplasma sp.]|nr:pantetheine-phosphate adenylyltransferase [Malacoplasma sp.]
MIRKALYAGSFNPIHEGHINIIKRAAKLFDVLYVAVSFNTAKKQESIAKRFIAVEKKIKALKLKNVHMVASRSFTTKKAKELGCKYLVRSVRDLKDFKYELTIAQNNHKLDCGIETVLFFADKDLAKFNSTSLRKEIAKVKKLGAK